MKVELKEHRNIDLLGNQSVGDTIKFGNVFYMLTDIERKNMEKITCISIQGDYAGQHLLISCKEEVEVFVFKLVEVS